MLSFLDEMDSFEREIFIIEKTCSLELSQIFQNYNAEVYMEETNKNGTETKKRSGGLVGMISSAAGAISKMLSTLIETISELFVGKKAKNDANVKFSKNPAQCMEAIDKSVREDIDMIEKLKNGEATSDDAKQMLSKHSSYLDEVEPYIGPIKEIAKEKIMSHAVLKKWKTQIDHVCLSNSKEMSASARELARSRSAESQNEVIDQAVQMVLNDIQKNTKEGSNILLDFGKQFYVKKEVTKRLRDEAESMTSLTGGISHRAQLRAERIGMKIDAFKTKGTAKRIDKNQRKNARAAEKNARAAEKLSEARAKRWNDVSAKKYTGKPTRPNPIRDKIKSAGDRGALNVDTDVHY